jgi:hypothetical protein
MGLGTVLTLVLVSACSSTEYVYRMYGGPERPDTEIAILKLGDAYEVEIDGRKVAHSDYSIVQLAPGTHRIGWSCEFGVSVMIEPSGWAYSGGSAEVELEAGHVYVLRCDRTTGPGYRTFEWISNETDGEVIAGGRKE